MPLDLRPIYVEATMDPLTQAEVRDLLNTKNIVRVRTEQEKFIAKGMKDAGAMTNTQYNTYIAATDLISPAEQRFGVGTVVVNPDVSHTRDLLVAEAKARKLRDTVNEYGAIYNQSIQLVQQETITTRAQYKQYWQDNL